MLALGLAIVAGAVAGVAAAPNPTEPSGTSVFNVGQQCTIKWDVDATSTWKNMNIQLMTGDNFQMIHLTTVAQNVDATDATKTTYSYTCPDVTPNSAIYFYQFSSPTNATDLLWTTRWTIASADGKTTPPTETTQPNGDPYPWGKGALVDPSTAVPPPSYLTNGQTNGSGNTTSASSAGQVVTSTVVVSTPPAAATTPVATTPAAGSSSHAAGSSSSSTARAASTGATTGASSSNSTGSTTTANGAATTTASGFAMIGALVAALGLF